MVQVEAQNASLFLRRRYLAIKFLNKLKFYHLHNQIKKLSCSSELYLIADYFACKISSILTEVFEYPNK